MLKFFHLHVTQPAVSNPPSSIALYSYFIMAVVYVSRGKAIMFYRCTLFFLFVSKGNLRGYWTDSIHTFTQYSLLVQFNIAPPKGSKSPPHRKSTQNPPKMGISETESDIRWRITLQGKFTSTIAALVHYEGLSTPKSG